MNSLSYFIIYSATFGLVVNFAAAQTVFIVGDNTGWTVPANTSFYSEWASGKTFVVGDTLGTYSSNLYISFQQNCYACFLNIRTV